jgi:hypothetical protein
MDPKAKRSSKTVASATITHPVITSRLARITSERAQTIRDSSPGRNGWTVQYRQLVLKLMIQQKGDG